MRQGNPSKSSAPSGGLYKKRSLLHAYPGALRPPQDDAPEIVRQMIETSAVFGIGPMAAVAGAIAKFAVQAMMDEGATYAVVDNGGDICILNDQPILVGIYAGSSPIRDLAFQLSGPARAAGHLHQLRHRRTVHQLWLGGCSHGDCAGCRPGGRCGHGSGKCRTAEGPLQECFQAIDRPGIDGALVIRGEEMALWKELPPLRRARVGAERITKG